MRSTRMLALAIAGATVLSLVGSSTLTAGAADYFQTGSCVDGGGRTWNSSMLWRDVYTDANGVKRVDATGAGWTTDAGSLATDSIVRTYDGSGNLLQDLVLTSTHDFKDGTDLAVRNPIDPPSAPGKAKVTITLGMDGDGKSNCTRTYVQPMGIATTPAPPPQVARPASSLTNLPGQPAITAYGSGSAATSFARPGALIVAGRDNYGDQAMKNASASGATVLIYLDAIIDNPYGRYHEMLNEASECGPATSRWPGNYSANSWGYLNDFRVGSVLQGKLKCVLEKMVAENPHMGGFFADDLGSRSWFPGVDWESWGTSNQQAYRDGAIALAQTLHEVAADHGLMVMVNGTWTAGSLARSGGGYPNMTQHGLGLADGGYIEHHDAGEVAYWAAYARGQWATAAGSAGRGKPFMYVQASDAATRDVYNAAGAFSFLSAQQEYSTASVWGTFYQTGLPSRAGE